MENQKFCILIESIKQSFITVFWLLWICYSSKTRFRLWFYRRVGRLKEAEQLSFNMVSTWSEKILAGKKCRLEIIGRENIPASGPIIVMSNHQSIFDIPILLSNLGRIMGFVAKQELFRIPGFSFWMKEIGCVSLDRSDALSAGRLFADLSKQIKETGAGLILFPEGTRSRDPQGVIAPFKAGSLRLPALEEIPILPVSIDGTRYLSMPDQLCKTKGGGRLVRIKIAPVVNSKIASSKERHKLMAEIRNTVVNGYESIRVHWPEKNDDNGRIKVKSSA